MVCFHSAWRDVAAGSRDGVFFGCVWECLLSQVTSQMHCSSGCSGVLILIWRKSDGTAVTGCLCHCRRTSWISIDTLGRSTIFQADKRALLQVRSHDGSLHKSHQMRRMPPVSAKNAAGAPQSLHILTQTCVGRLLIILVCGAALQAAAACARHAQGGPEPSAPAKNSFSASGFCCSVSSCGCRCETCAWWTPTC